MVEGGTLLRCYTSQRGIEGSNPSSSAPKGPRLQGQRGVRANGRERFWPLLHQRNQNTLFATTNRVSVIVDLYSRPPEVVVALAVPPGLFRPHGASVSADIQDAGYKLRGIHLLGTSVHRARRRAETLRCPALLTPLIRGVGHDVIRSRPSPQRVFPSTLYYKSPAWTLQQLIHGLASAGLTSWPHNRLINTPAHAHTLSQGRKSRRCTGSHRRNLSSYTYTLS